MGNDIAIASLKEKIDDLNQQAWEARVKDSTKAFQLSEESVKLARSINYTKGLAEGLRSLGFGYIRLFKNEEAAPLLRESLSLFQSLNDLTGQGVVYGYLGIIERNLGNLGASLELLLKGYVLIQQVGSLEIEATCCYQIGVTYKHLGNHETALDYLYQALSIAKKIGFALMEGYAMNIIGSIYFDNGDYSHALDFYQQGLVIRRESNDKWGEAGSLDNIGFAYLKLNDLGKAIDYCNQSLAISQSTDDKKGEANALLHLAEIYQQAGDVDQASKFSDESLEIRKARGDRRGETEVLLFLADLHKSRSDTGDHQVFEWLSGALKTAEEIKAQDLLSKAYYNLHEYHTQKGNFKESLIQLEAHLQIEKELHKNTINQKVANLEISHKAEIISERNKELTELNEKIEKANEELKVEASLERVRAVTMSMNKPDDVLNICKVMFTELQTLEFKDLRNALINFWDDDNSLLLDYDYSDFSGGNFAKLSYSSHPVFEAFQKKVRKATDAFAELVVSEDELETWKQRRRDSGEYEDPRLNNISALYYYFYSTGVGALGISTFSPIPKDKLDVLKRFRNVFDLTYRRYLDIVKAETQAREAQIEAALERVRAKSMAMHHSDDLISVINVVQEQLLGLGFHFHGANFVTDYNEKGYTMWLASPGESFPFKIYVPQIGQKYFEAVKEAIEKGSDFATYILNFEEKNIYFKNLFENSLARNTSEEGKRMVYESKGMAASVVLLDKVRLNLMNLDLIPFTDEENKILRRFGYVFEQSYTRFLDLQKAEAQAREAQIELGLERVRARAMAMQRSDELTELVDIVFKELTKLHFTLDRCIIIIVDEKSRSANYWMANPESRTPTSYHLELKDIPYLIATFNAWKERKTKMVYDLKGDEKSSTVEYIFSKTEFQLLPEEVKQGMKNTDRIFLNSSFNNFGGLQADTIEPLSEENLDIIYRFSKVFDLTYTRFNDLKQAEAQARDAQIETGLERVRSKTMAMHKSEEVTGVAVSLSEELLKLGFEGGSTIIIIDSETGDTEQWTGFSEDKSLKSSYVPYFKHPCHEALLDGWKKGEKFLVYTLAGDEKRSLDEHYFTTGYKDFPESDKRWMRQMESVTFSYAFMKYGAIHWGPGHLTEEQLRILQRFSKVFEQSYTRFLDLQKAEAQAREAKIEAALEKVRSRSLAMHKSDELQEVVKSVFERFDELKIEINTAIIMIFSEQSKDSIWWLVNKKNQQYSRILVKYADYPFFKKLFEDKENGKELFSGSYSKKEKNEIFKYFFEQTDFKYTPEEQKKYIFDSEHFTISVALTKKIGIQITSYSKRSFSEEENEILKRFAKVFDQAYTRFLDLQKAEAQAREAEIQLALERVRARTMAMQQGSELSETAKVLFEQFTSLGYHPDRFAIAIVNEEERVFDYWVTQHGGFFMDRTLKFSVDEPHVMQKMYKAWKTKTKSITLDLQGQPLKEYFEFLKNVNAPVSGDQFIERRVQNVATFSKGILTIISKEPTPPEVIEILERFALVFDGTYTRFLDLKNAEAHAEQARLDLIQIQHEKKRAEEALVELQATQKQLIQSEKMASLGELTAGIAHEIQNPLNFVNNFSDVSNELLEEMKHELATGNTQQAIEIVNDVKENLEKILHHGKRADAIVKSMLQHSRSSAGKKELTDINSLAEEYFRLAYHGLRAKDKSFNAKFETDLDKSIGKINIISQDVGRVILNLINNAFYAVNEKKRHASTSSAANGYEPMVTISTKKTDDKVEVKIRDNGDGIPQKVLDKIFQPFFTTKPTGQGTGLGLSLSYDIITKGHGGELLVKTKEGEGTEFIISLPVN